MTPSPPAPIQLSRSEALEQLERLRPLLTEARAWRYYCSGDPMNNKLIDLIDEWTAHLTHPVHPRADMSEEIQHPTLDEVRRWPRRPLRRPRWWAHLRADVGGYFWLPCDACGRYSGGQEWKQNGYATYHDPEMGPGRGNGFCPGHYEASPAPRQSSQK